MNKTIVFGMYETVTNTYTMVIDIYSTVTDIYTTVTNVYSKVTMVNTYRYISLHSVTYKPC